jgi:hypothetical protein
MRCHVITVVIILANLVSIDCQGFDAGTLVNIVNKSPYEVKIKTTDRLGTIVTKDGKTHTEEGVREKSFFLSDIKSLNLTIPWKGWSGAAKIYIDVVPSKDNNSLVSRAELTEENGEIKFWTQNSRGATNTQSIPRTQPTQYILLINEAGETSFSQFDASAATGFNVGTIVNIINKSQYEVKIKSTDQAGSIVTKDGKVHTGKDGIQDKTFFLSDVGSLNLTIPWAGWDGAAKIYIDVVLNKNSDKLVSRAELMERKGQVELWTQNNGDATLKKSLSVPRNKPTQFSLLVDEAGEINFASKDEDGQLITTTKNSPPRITFVFDGIDKQITVGSPNCSIETDITKQFKTVASGTHGAETTLLMKDNCKLLIMSADPQGNTLSATACFGFVEKKGGKWIPTNIKSPDNFHEIGCTDPECAPDQDTGISACDKLGLSWVEGLDPKTGSRIRGVGPNNYKAFYGIVRVKP